RSGPRPSSGRVRRAGGRRRSGRRRLHVTDGAGVEHAQVRPSGELSDLGDASPGTTSDLSSTAAPINCANIATGAACPSPSRGTIATRPKRITYIPDPPRGDSIQRGGAAGANMLAGDGRGRV